MDHVNSLLDQIARLEAQNRLEADPDLQRENKETIKKLHRELRKAARFRHPWHGLIRNILLLFIVFFGAVFGLLRLSKAFGWESTCGASFIAAIVLTLITATILLVTNRINQDTYKSLVNMCLEKFSSIFTDKKSIVVGGDNESKQEHPHLLDGSVQQAIFGAADQALPPPEENQPE